MKKYYGTYKMSNGCFFTIYVNSKNNFVDEYGQIITKAEMKQYQKID